jgi:hypothetical protein
MRSIGNITCIYGGIDIKFGNEYGENIFTLRKYPNNIYALYRWTYGSHNRPRFDINGHKCIIDGVDEIESYNQLC